MLGSIISHLRKKKGISQGDLSKSLNITQTYLSMIERNKREPNLGLLKRIATQLAVPYQIIVFMTMTKEDIPEDRREIFGSLFEGVKSDFLNS